MTGIVTGTETLFNRLGWVSAPRWYDAVPNVHAVPGNSERASAETVPPEALHLGGRAKEDAVDLSWDLTDLAVATLTIEAYLHLLSGCYQ